MIFVDLSQHRQQGTLWIVIASKRELVCCHLQQRLGTDRKIVSLENTPKFI